MCPVTELPKYRRTVFELLEQIQTLDYRDKNDFDNYSNGESCHLDPNIEEDDDEPFKNQGLGFWVDD